MADFDDSAARYEGATLNILTSASSANPHQQKTATSAVIDPLLLEETAMNQLAAAPRMGVTDRTSSMHSQKIYILILADHHLQTTPA
jgi:hypothetical protein